MDEKNKYLMEDGEAEQLLNRRPGTEIVNPAPASAGQPPDVVDRYQGGVVSSIGLQTDTANSQIAGKNPVYRLMPATIAGNPAQNASVQSVAKQSGASGGNILLNLGLVMPSEFDVTGSPITKTPGEFDVSWAPEAAGTVFSGPPFDSVGFDVSTPGAGGNWSDPTPGGVALITGPQPSQDGEWALYVGVITGGTPWAAPAAPWVDTGASGGSSYPVFFQSIPAGATSVSVSQAFATYSAWAGSISYFGGTLPSIVQFNNTGSTDSTGLCSLAFGSALTAGNAVLVIVSYVTTGPLSSTSVTVTDTQGLTPIQLATSASGVHSGLGEGAQSTLFMMSDAANLGETINVQVDPQGGVSGANVTIIEITPLTPIPARPRFRLPPPASASNISGIVPNTSGGTGSNLGATGGANQVLKQSTVGGNITVGVLSAANLSNGISTNGGTTIPLVVGILGTGTSVVGASSITGSGTIGVLATGPTISAPSLTGTTTIATVSETGKHTKYLNVALVGAGLPSQVANFGAIMSSDQPLFTLYAVPSAGAGFYRLVYYLIVTTAASVSSTLSNVSTKYTDQANSTVQLLSAVATVPTGNSLTTMFSGEFVLNVKASTNIQLQTGDTTAYASVGGTAMAFELLARLEFLG